MDQQSEMTAKVQPLIDAVVRAETTLQQLQEGFGEMAVVACTMHSHYAFSRLYPPWIQWLWYNMAVTP